MAENEAKRSTDEFLWALKNGDLDKVQEIVNGKESVVTKEIQGRCPIHYASDYGHAHVVDFLVKKGASIDAPDIHGISPLLVAIMEKHTDTVALLLKKGAKADGKWNDQTYLEVAETDDIKALLSQVKT